MITRITVWTLAWDTHQGTNCKVFATEKELDSHIEQIVRDDLSNVAGQEVEVVRSLLNAGKVWEAWDQWCEKFKDALDTYYWDSQPLEIKLS